MLYFRNLWCDTACSSPMTPMSLKMRRSSESHHRDAHQGFKAGLQWPASDVTATASVFNCLWDEVANISSFCGFHNRKTWNKIFYQLEHVVFLLLLEMWMHCNINWCFLRLSVIIYYAVSKFGRINQTSLSAWLKTPKLQSQSNFLRLILCSPNSCFTAAGGI